MVKLLADAGTSWTKVLELVEDKPQLTNSPMEKLINTDSCAFEYVQSRDINNNAVFGRVSLLSTRLINQHSDILFDAATGHMSFRRVKKNGKYENELVAMALGAMKVVKEPDVTIVDLGSRDSKWIKYNNFKYKDLDWNGTCGSGTGATIEMVCNFYDVDTDELPLEKEKIAVTCGVFGMEKIMDLVARGVPSEIAISRYIHGIAFNVWNFARCPDKIYLSGGLCLNKCFVNSLKLYTDVHLLGRFILLEGLY
jgi:activator of 2-hydroxyglutaryl-CoA dehydratase